ncbi:MAG: ABC transporter substrate-binding protein [Myxococcaceae bacterium]
MRGALSILVLTVAIEALAAPRLPEDPPRDDDASIDVVFLNMFLPGEPWSEQVVSSMRAAAEDLGIHLTVEQAGRWPQEILLEAERLLTGPQRPDYLIVVAHPTIGVRLLRLAEQAHVPVLVINTGFSTEEQKEVGRPREHFSWWLGQVLPDDDKAGYDLATSLIAEARRAGRTAADGRIHVVALTGGTVHPASSEREKGLRRAVEAQENVVLHQAVDAKWEFDDAQRKTLLLLRRYPETSAIWAANDQMALGAIEAVTTTGRAPGRDMIVGGIGWVPQALRAVQEGELAVTFGGHFLEGAWALVLIYDHAHGKDFGTAGTVWRTELVPITREDLPGSMHVVGNGRPWDTMDFRSYSRVANPGRTGYRFSPAALLDALDAKRPTGPGP